MKNEERETLFQKNKYTRIYYKLIESRQLFERKKESSIYEEHHIIPKSIGGSNRKNNLVFLTPKEHFVCHLLLTKMVYGKNVGKMYYALLRMKDKGQTSNCYDYFVSKYAYMSKGENNPFYGKTHSDEVKQKIFGENHPMYGKKHTLESRKQMSEAKKGMFTGSLNPMYGIKKTDEQKKKQSEKLSGMNHFNYGKESFNKNRIWMNDNIKQKMIKKEHTEEYVSNGWKLGRL